jgi:hypothetical protein
VGNEVANMNQPIHISYLYPGSRTVVTQIEETRFIPSHQNERDLDSQTVLRPCTGHNQFFPLLVACVDLFS